MGLRVKPTYRQRRFGSEVRQLRERAGLSSSDAARLLGIKQPQLSNVESGKTGLSPARVLQLADAAGVKSGPFIEALNDMGQDSGKGWWTSYRKDLGESHLDLAELESGAVALRNYELLFIPGLLQTADYAMAVHGGGYAESVREVQNTAVEFRMERQRVLVGDHPPKLHAIIHEAALRVLYGGREVMREQLLKLVEASRLPNVTIQVVPLEDEQRAAFNHSFMVIEPNVLELGTVLVDQLATAQLLGETQAIADYTESFARLSELALPPVDTKVAPEQRRVKDSLGLIQHILYPLL
ncbi:helix-turn-helix transcriptional regulator [Streptomyces buecherae]|uniref:helix-turn-helix domain-containing protein n=1 Tax=Streptomyces buecherae TaxID=2763006 RepID=UPI0033C0B49A